MCKAMNNLFVFPHSSICMGIFLLPVLNFCSWEVEKWVGPLTLWVDSNTNEMLTESFVTSSKL